MDPLWSGICWSNLKYFKCFIIILIVSTIYVFVYVLDNKVFQGRPVYFMVLPKRHIWIDCHLKLSFVFLDFFKYKTYFDNKRQLLSISNKKNTLRKLLVHKDETCSKKEIAFFYVQNLGIFQVVKFSVSFGQNICSLSILIIL